MLVVWMYSSFERVLWLKRKENIGEGKQWKQKFVPNTLKESIGESRINLCVSKTKLNLFFILFYF